MIHLGCFNDFKRLTTLFPMYFVVKSHFTCHFVASQCLDMTLNLVFNYGLAIILIISPFVAARCRPWQRTSLRAMQQGHPDFFGTRTRSKGDMVMVIQPTIATKIRI